VRSLILIRHSTPDIRRDIPAAEWHLSPDGAARARAFSQRLHPSAGARVFTSCEPKAVETAQLLAEEWGLEVETVPGLHEHERPEAQMLSRAAFDQSIRDLFAQPRTLVFGAETADGARRRFTIALMRLVARTAGDVLVVTHGTVLTLFVAETTGVEPYAFWKRQQMPFAVNLTLPDLRLERTTFLGS
jgi:broad specificity phosphatase PhoE